MFDDITLIIESGGRPSHIHLNQQQKSLAKHPADFIPDITLVLIVSLGMSVLLMYVDLSTWRFSRSLTKSFPYHSFGVWFVWIEAMFTAAYAKIAGKETPKCHDRSSDGVGEGHSNFVSLHNDNGISSFSDTSESVQESAEDSVHIAFSETTEVQGPDFHDDLDTSLADIKESLGDISKQVIDIRKYHEGRFDGIEDTYKRMTEALERLERRMEPAERERKVESSADDPGV
jgi:hypothetical protein